MGTNFLQTQKVKRETPLFPSVVASGRPKKYFVEPILWNTSTIPYPDVSHLSKFQILARQFR